MRVKTTLMCRLRNIYKNTHLYDGLLQETDESAVEFLIQEGADLDAKFRNGSTPLHFASVYSSQRVVNLLLDSGANINAINYKGHTALHLAVEHSSLEIVKLLLSKGSDINAKSFDKFTPLHIAIKNLRSEIAIFLIDMGANIGANDGERSALICASQFGCIPIAKLLVNKGVDLNHKNELRHTALHIALSTRNDSIAEILINSGRADLNSCEAFNVTPFFIAVVNKSTKIIKCLLENKADCNIASYLSETPITHVITQSPDVEVIRLCIDNGAYLKPIDYDGLMNEPMLKENILNDTAICSQAVVNRFNNADLPELYKIPMCIEKLPSFDKLKIVANRAIAQDIEDTVKYQIDTKGFCNFSELPVISLTLLCVKSFNKYYDNINDDIIQVPKKKLKI